MRVSVIQTDPSVVVEAMERVARLPAIPTHDWCEQAATAVSEALFNGSGVVAVGVGAVDGNKIDHFENVGVAASGNVESMANELRTRISELGAIQASLGAAGPSSENPLVIAPASQIAQSSSWKSTSVSRLLVSRGLSAVLIGAGLIADADPSRALWILGAVEGGAAYIGDTVFAMVILLATLRKAKLAMTGVGSDASAWISPREQEILKELMLGKSVRQIAEETGRSPHTIHDHVKSLHRKLNATSRGELIARTLGHVSQASRVRESSRKIRQV